MRKITRKGIRNKLSKLVADMVKERDNYTCQKCGKKLSKQDCHASHVIPVSAGLRWAYDPLNVKVLCFHCHLNWWHKNPTEAGEWFRKAFPKRWQYIQEMKPIYNDHKTIKAYELEELFNELQSRNLEI